MYGILGPLSSPLSPRLQSPSAVRAARPSGGAVKCKDLSDPAVIRYGIDQIMIAGKEHGRLGAGSGAPPKDTEKDTQP